MNTSDAVRYLKRRSDSGNWFHFFLDYLEVMSRDAALTLQIIINSSKRKPKKKQYQKYWKDNWCLCTMSYLEKKLKMSRNTQQRVLDELKGKDAKGKVNPDMAFVEVKQFGTPAKRFIKVDYIKIEQAIDKANEVAGKAVTKVTRKPVSSEVAGKAVTKVTRKPVTNTDNKESDNGKTNGVAHRNGVCSGFFDQPEKRTPEYILASKLDHILRTKEKELLRETHLPSWAKHFRKLLNHRTEDQIDAMLDWYNQNIDNDWCPQKYAAKTFCEDYPKLEEARKRFAKKERDREYQEALANQFN